MSARDSDNDGCDDCAVGTDDFGVLADNTPANDGTDNDNDGICNTGDECPDDPNKVEEGLCGCGTPDTDTDGDGTPDCLEQEDDYRITGAIRFYYDGDPVGQTTLTLSGDMFLCHELGCNWPLYPFRSNIWKPYSDTLQNR